MQEKTRLEILKSYRILDTPVEKSFDELAQIASSLADCPMVLIQFVDENRLWPKASVGLPRIEKDREPESLCSKVVVEKKTLVIEDLAAQAGAAQSPMIRQLGIQFYVGVPLMSKEGAVLGTICAMDVRARDLPGSKLKGLEILAKQVVHQLELRKSLLEARGEQLGLHERTDVLKSFFEASTDLVGLVEVHGDNVIPLLENQNVRDFVKAEAQEKKVEMSNPPLISFLSRFFWLTKFRQSEKTKRPFEFEYYKEDNQKWFDCVVNFVGQGPHGESRFSYVIRDISDEKKTRDMIELQKMKLIGAAKMSALGEMAAGMAHEINNPLAIIRGSTQLLRRQLKSSQPDPKSLEENLERIESTVVRISQIITGLKNFARDGETDTASLVPVRKVIQDTLELCQTRFRHHDVKLEAPLVPEEFVLECRPVQVSQVLLNLLNNAFDAVLELPDKWVRIEVQELESEYCFSVVDSGKGIPAEVAAKMMQPFFTTKEVGKGTGLGLSLSKGMIEAHRGRLLFDSEFPHTCFRIFLPKKITAKKSQAA